MEWVTSGRTQWQSDEHHLEKMAKKQAKQKAKPGDIVPKWTDLRKLANEALK